MNGCCDFKQTSEIAVMVRLSHILKNNKTARVKLDFSIKISSLLSPIQLAECKFHWRSGQDSVIEVYRLAISPMHRNISFN